MCEIQRFLTTRILGSHRLKEPDARLLYQYECTDQDFWCLVDLLRECDPPRGEHFNQYRRRWRDFRERNPEDGQFSSGMTAVDWQIRGFVLYASEFWRRFKHSAWRKRNFPDQLPFEKLTWLQFLSLIRWTQLYKEKIAGCVELYETGYLVAYASSRHVNNSNREFLDSLLKTTDHVATNKGHYPGLYFPMLAAWHWWKVAPVRLPSSIRYLDTFAHQGGSSDRLVIEYRMVFEDDSEVIYRPVKPPSGYGIDVLTIAKEDLRMVEDYAELNITLLFGQHDGPGSV